MSTAYCCKCRADVEYIVHTTCASRIIKDAPTPVHQTCAMCVDCHTRVYVDGLVKKDDVDTLDLYRQQEGLISMTDINRLVTSVDNKLTTLALLCGIPRLTLIAYTQGVDPTPEDSATLCALLSE